jgi:hypothetical protein
MPDKEFLELVKKMRGAQKEYFKTRNYDVLNKPKHLEKQVDTELAILQGDVLV